MDEIRDRLKTTDKEEPPRPNYLTFSDVMQNNGSVLRTRAEQDRATQDLVDKKIIGSLVIVGDARKANPFKTKSAKKRKKLQRELEKLGEEVLAKIPAENLARLTEALSDEGTESDASSFSDSLKEGLKALVESVTVVKEKVDDEDKQEVAVANPAANAVSTSLPLSTTPHNHTNALAGSP
jgi:hypothetical protein